MEGIELTKEQTLQLIYISRKLETPNRYNFDTKIRWNCLKCFTEIYLKYHTRTKITDIYCNNCQDDAKISDTNIKKVQHRFVNKINEHKLKFINEFFDF